MSGNYMFQDGNFTIADYQNQSPFVDFLPGIAGLKGKPVWAFFINRGQGIAGFGVRDKDGAIMEFSPAEIAYTVAPRQGFRTFLRMGGKTYEPFQVCGDLPDEMIIMRRGFAIKEERAGKYKIDAEYFGVPSQNYAALCRTVTITNLSEKEEEIEFCDGLARLIPYGLSNGAFKETGNLFKSWMCAEGVNEGYGFYKMRSSTADSCTVEEIGSGNFSVALCDKCELSLVVDPAVLFGQEKTLTRAVNFERAIEISEAIAEQNTENEFPCAISYGKLKLKSGECARVVQLIGYAEDERRVKELKKELSVDKVFAMREEAEEIISEIVRPVCAKTAFPVFDEYLKQSCFDNVLRGGMPVMIGETPYYVYSRKHGDPERDYNFFSIEPQAYSCGNGNFRDVVQNRRNDAYYYPESGDFNIRYFFSLLQADGYNPLSVTGVKYVLKSGAALPEQYAVHEPFLKSEFTVGELCNRLQTTDGKTIAGILALCRPVYQAGFGEGYWTDHFDYLVDLILSYLSVYPERKDELLYRTPLKYFRSGACVLPRGEKTVLLNGKVRRIGSVNHNGADGWLKAGEEELSTCLAAKLLTLIAVKTATLDPLGCGVDMEADKPGWNDATNGLPALFGSNVADAIELKRLIAVTKELLSDEEIIWSSEQSGFFRAMTALLEEDVSPSGYFEQSNALKEAYRAQLYTGLSGGCATESGAEIKRFLSLAEERVAQGLERAKMLGGGAYPTYLAFEAVKYTVTDRRNKDGYPLVNVTEFAPRALPLFAEGIAKGLSAGEKELYRKARATSLYDEKLGIYRSSESLEDESMEIGRIRSFPVGWLERESCFLHMNYKLMLSLLQAGLYQEFYKEIRSNLVPFMNPEVYGRSTLENCSFLPTSTHKDAKKRGKGYQARLTGANAEVLSMWRMMTGASFSYENELVLSFRPVLAKEFFAKDGELKFTLLGRTEVVYRNLGGKDTFDQSAKLGTVTLWRDGKKTEVNEVKGALANEVREGKFQKIEVEIL